MEAEMHRRWLSLMKVGAGCDAECPPGRDANATNLPEVFAF